MIKRKSVKAFLYIHGEFVKEIPIFSGNMSEKYALFCFNYALGYKITTDDFYIDFVSEPEARIGEVV